MVKPIFDVFDPTTHPTEFAGEVNESLDYIEFGITTVEGYVATKLYFDELLNDGNYLNDLQSYEDGILDYYNTEYGASETVLTDGILNNLSAKEMEVLTISLTNGVVFQEHKDQVLIYYNDFRGNDTNATVYNNIKTYLTPLQQGIARLLASHVGDIFISGTDAYNDLVTWSDAFKDSVIAAIGNDIDLAIKINEANTLYTNLTATITTGTTLNTDLAANITLAGTTNTDLTGVVTTAANNITLLNAANTTAQATLTDLNAAIASGDVASKEETSNKVTAFQVTPDDTHYPTEKLVKDQLDLKSSIVDIKDDLISIDTNKPLSANQGKVLKGLIDTITIALESDDLTLDTLQEVVDFIELNKATLDTLGISNIAGLQTALNAKINTSSIGSTVQAYSANLDTADRIDKVIQTKNITAMAYAGGSGTDKLSEITYSDSYSESLYYDVNDKLQYIDHKLSAVVVGYTTLAYTASQLTSYTFTLGAR